jgi:uncharacterized membrane protein (DUF485 family)
MDEPQAVIELERLLRRHRILAWSLAGVIFAMTIGFFALMGFDSPIVSQIVIGRSITAANVIAVGMILVFLLSIAVFGRSAARIDEALNDRVRGR